MLTACTTVLAVLVAKPACTALVAELADREDEAGERVCMQLKRRWLLGMLGDDFIELIEPQNMLVVDRCAV